MKPGLPSLPTFAPPLAGMNPFGGLLSAATGAGMPPAAAPSDPWSGARTPGPASTATASPNPIRQEVQGPPNPMVGYANAIKAIESSGRYDILGDVVPKTGDRAYGAYQVMGNNVGPWTQEVLGRRMSPQEFLRDPAAQDRVFQTKFQQFIEQYGSPQDAASVWFTGEPLSRGSGKADQHGTTGRGYVAQFNDHLRKGTTFPSADRMMALNEGGSSDPTGVMGALKMATAKGQQAREQVKKPSFAEWLAERASRVEPGAPPEDLSGTPPPDQSRRNALISQGVQRVEAATATSLASMRQKDRLRALMEYGRSLGSA